MWVRLQWDRVGAWVCIAAGVIVLVVGWIGISSKIYPGEELPYILSGGIGGVFLLGLGGMLWLSADLRDEWRKLDRIERAIYETGGVVTNGNGAHFGQEFLDPSVPGQLPAFAAAPAGSQQASTKSPGAGSFPPTEPASGPPQHHDWDVQAPDGDPVSSGRRSRPLSARPLSGSRRTSASRLRLDAEE
jgi:hypothetical protein